MPLGPVVIDVAGPELDDEDRRRLAHPLAGGVILFARNYEKPEQLQRLTAAIHALREPALVIAVDHEGGRVQRFKQGFTVLPPMRTLGLEWDRSRQEARRLAHETGYVLAAELRAHGVDLSFAPVLDVDHGASSVIGDRAFHSDPEAVADLAAALLELAASRAAGVLHVAGADAVSRAELAELVVGRPVATAVAPPTRPLDCRLDSSRAQALLRTRLRGVREVLPRTRT
jgi:beta-glucosidase-like glycosyl hydrolase